MFGAVVAAMAAAWLYLTFFGNRLPVATVVVGDSVTVRADVVATPAERAQGLSGRSGLREDEGMLFLFEVPARHQFWMQDMTFPIDIIWIRQGEIVDMAMDVPPPGPDGSLPVYTPREAADAVLEVRAGFAATHGLRAGIPVAWEVDR